MKDLSEVCMQVSRPDIRLKCCSFGSVHLGGFVFVFEAGSLPDREFSQQAILAGWQTPGMPLSCTLQH